MDGVSDLGGVEGFGRLTIEVDEPVFHHDWEARVMAMRILMGFWGITGMSSPGKSYNDSNSRISKSTKSNNSSSSTWSTLFINTTMYGTPTWRATKMCSRV